MCAPFFHTTPLDTTTPVTVVSVTTMSSFVVQRRGPCELLTHSSHRLGCAAEVPLTRTCDARRHRDRSPLNFRHMAAEVAGSGPLTCTPSATGCGTVYLGNWHRQESL